MANPPYIQEANPENFKTLVLENSDRGPVMVFYWSPRAGPCMKLMPRLIRLADEYCGKFMLVLLDTDEYGRLAKDEYGVTSVPTVKFFRHGKVAHTVHGAESDSEFRRSIDKFVPREASMAQVNASRAYHQEGDLDQACALLSKAMLDDPDNARIALDLAKLLILKGDYTRAESVLQSLPAAAREEDEISTLLVHAGFLRVAQNAPEIEILEGDILAEPDKSVARYQLSALKLMQNDYAGAMQQLLEIVRRDRDFREDAGRKGLIAIFNMLGNENALVASYRSLLTEALA
jgi:putative thioredoxin